MKSCVCNMENDNTGYMGVVERHSFALTDADGCPEMRCHEINKSCEYALKSVQC